MSTKKRCARCPKRSLPGLIPNPGYCAFHYAEYMWGRAWAETCYPIQACFKAAEFCVGIPSK